MPWSRLMKRLFSLLKAEIEIYNKIMEIINFE
jgi:hypothetical protein